METLKGLFAMILILGFCVGCIYFSYWSMKRMFSKLSVKELFCKSCGTISKPINATPGSIWLELFLWAMGGLPGLLYSMWRLSNKFKVCPSCKSKDIIPADSPNANKKAS